MSYRHGEAELVPSHYEDVDWFDNAPLTDIPIRDASAEGIRRIRERVERKREQLRERSSSKYAPVGQCAHCGAYLRYHVILRDDRDQSLIAVGETCASDRFGLSDESWEARKDDLDRMRGKAARGQKRVKVSEEYPEAAELLEECLSEWEDHPAVALWEIEQGRGPREILDRWPSFVIDIAAHSFRHGRLTDAQAEAVLDAVPRHRERMRERREEEASRDPAPEGRHTVEGEVIKYEIRENGYGSRVVITVKTEAGWLAWGTCPKSFRWEVERGDRVRFDAELERSDDDESFAFYSRPTKAELIASDQD